VIFDDILINSDDARASAALEVLGGLAKRTQVLFFGITGTWRSSDLRQEPRSSRSTLQMQRLPKQSVPQRSLKSGL